MDKIIENKLKKIFPKVKSGLTLLKRWLEMYGEQVTKDFIEPITDKPVNVNDITNAKGQLTTAVELIEWLEEYNKTKEEMGLKED